MLRFAIKYHKQFCLGLYLVGLIYSLTVISAFAYLARAILILLIISQLGVEVEPDEEINLNQAIFWGLNLFTPFVVLISTYYTGVHFKSLSQPEEFLLSLIFLVSTVGWLINSTIVFFSIGSKTNLQERLLKIIHGSKKNPPD